MAESPRPISLGSPCQDFLDLLIKKDVCTEALNYVYRFLGSNVKTLLDDFDKSDQPVVKWSSGVLEICMSELTFAVQRRFMDNAQKRQITMGRWIRQQQMAPQNQAHCQNFCRDYTPNEYKELQELGLIQGASTTHSNETS